MRKTTEATTMFRMLMGRSAIKWYQIAVLTSIVDQGRLRVWSESGLGYPVLLPV